MVLDPVVPATTRKKKGPTVYGLGVMGKEIMLQMFYEDSQSQVSVETLDFQSIVVPHKCRYQRSRPEASQDHQGRVRKSSIIYLATKRAVDIVVALLLIGLTLPLLILTSIAIKLVDFGPILYTHTRVGLRGREFRCFKFRTMVPNADRLKAGLANAHTDSRTFKLKKDPRITIVGAFLRRWSIDELPQLFNVLNGSMSLVGPRPPIPSEVALYEPADLIRLEAKPGLTCIWQVSGRSMLDFEKQIELDRQYIANRSLWLDLKLLVRTVPAVLVGRGAW